MPPLWVTFVLANVLAFAQGVFIEVRKRRREEAERWAETCRDFDAVLRPQGFVPERFDGREAVWRHENGTSAVAKR